MSDLISRSELIDALKVHFDSCFREDGELLYSDHICTSEDVVKDIGEEKAAEYSIKNLTRNLAESLVPMLTIEKEYDSQCMRHIITAKVRVVEPDYRF